VSKGHRARHPLNCQTVASDARGYAATLSENLRCTKGFHFCRPTNGPKVADIVRRDRDDLVNTSPLRCDRPVCHGGLLRCQCLGRSRRAGVYDGKFERRREYHAVCRTRRSGQQLRPRRTAIRFRRPDGPVWRSTGPINTFRSFPRLRLQLPASRALCSPPRQRRLNKIVEAEAFSPPRPSSKDGDSVHPFGLR
jgi:hypothetical protein